MSSEIHLPLSVPASRVDTSLPVARSVSTFATTAINRSNHSLHGTPSHVEKGLASNEGSLPLPEDPRESRWLTGAQLYIVHTGMLLAVLLFALDQSIVATAIPKIASEFNAVSSITWIATAYFLTQAGFVLFYGGLLTIFSTKYVFLSAILIFELGSLVCAVAKTINVLIFGRAFAGVGAAGIFATFIAMIAEIAPLEKRPALFGSFGADFALAAVLGPLLGGVFTDKVSWRWCFWINLPIGAISALVIIIFFKNNGASGLVSADSYNYTTLQRWLRLDWAGTILCLGIVTSLLLPLQWGGNTRPWSDPTVIALFVVFGVLLALFILLEWKLGDRAILPLKMFKRRTQVGACLSTFFIMLMLLVGTYELPLYYQAQGHSATKSGIDILPFMLLTVGASAISGIVINKTGRYWWWLFLSPLVASVGSALLFTINENTSNAKLIGYQILFGCGIGATLQNAFIAIQAEYNSEEDLIPQSSSMVTFTQLIGGIVGIALAGSIFANQLVTQLHQLAPDLSSETVELVRNSVTAIFDLPEEQQEAVIAAYSRALRYVFLLGIPSGVLASLSALLVKDYDIQNMQLNAAAAG